MAVNYQRLSDQAARRFGVPPGLLRALFKQESGWNPSARSPEGALGIAQFMPGTARGLGINPLNPGQAIPAAAKHLATLNKNLPGGWGTALAGYNAGAGAVQKYHGIPPYAETKNYVKKIMGQAVSAGAAAPMASTGQGAGGGASLPPAFQHMLRAHMAETQAGQLPNQRRFKQMLKLAQQYAGAAQGAVAQQATATGPAFAQGLGSWRAGGGPEAHGSRALGNWQSDNAYDIMGKAGQTVAMPVAGRVIKISGKPGGDPGFAGYGITIRTARGDLFFKHLGSAKVKVGQSLRPGQIIGTLDPSTAGGPHLHLGGTNRGFLDSLYKSYLGK